MAARRSYLLALAAGSVWGLGLARLIAEARLNSLLFGSAWLAAAVSGLAGLALAVLWARAGWRPFSALPLSLPLLYALGLAEGPLAGLILAAGGVALAFLIAWQERPRWVLPTMLVVVVLGFYLVTLLPSVGTADTMEFQVVVARLQVAHPTGYPLYILLTHPFTWIPMGTIAWRVNLASALYATGAVLVLFDITRHLSGRPLASLLAALTFAFSRAFWSQAIVAEVYALHNLMVVLLLWLLLRWRGQDWRWPVLALLSGLSLANHLTTVLLLPGLALGLLLERPRMPLRTWLLAAGLFALGLLLYLYIPLRWPAVNDGELMSWQQFAEHITARQFQGALQWAGCLDLDRWGIVGRVLLLSLGWVGAGFASLGAVAMLRKRRYELCVTGVTLVAFLLYGLAYHVPDIAVFVIPGTLVMSVWLGAGIASLQQLAERRLASSVAGVVILGALAVLPLSLIWTNLPQVDRSADLGWERWGRHVLNLPLQDGAAVLADVERFAPLHYLSSVEGIRPDLEAVILGEEALYRAELASRLDAGQPVYLARYLSHLEAYHLRSVGPLAEVARASLPVSGPPETVVAQDLGSGIILRGYDLQEVDDGVTLAATLHWQAPDRTARDYVVRFRLVDSLGVERWRAEGVRPVGGLYPTNAWRPGERLTDYHSLVVPPYLWGGQCELQVALYPPLGEEDQLAGDEMRWVPLEPVALEGAELPDPPTPALAHLVDGLWLTGFGAPGTATVGERVSLLLHWWQDAAQEPSGLGLSWVDATGRTVAESGLDLALASTAGALQTIHQVTAPTTEGIFSLLLTTGSDVARCRWLARPGEACLLATVEVEASVGLADLGGSVYLLEAEVGQEQATPGDAVDVLLLWTGRRPIEDDYTVTVQLLGPDGRLHGQVDSWPVQGTLPTSQWVPGEEVLDSYQVVLGADAPEGGYQVLVGLYLLETMERLPVLDSSGQPIGDHVVIGEFQALAR
jgi:hypothetical protein